MSKEYNKYLQEHRNNVAAAFYWLQTNLPEVLKGDYDYERQITADHDQSKSDGDEYNAYDAYFYGKDQSHAVERTYQDAWLMHIHKNPHHWQYWVLNNDDPKEGEVLIDIPYNYVIEMICDWWSFGFKDNNLYEIFDYYNKRKSYMKISNNSKNVISYILGEIHKKLKENDQNIGRVK